MNKKKPILLLIAVLAVLAGLFLSVSPITSAKQSPASRPGFFGKLENGNDYTYMVIGDSIGRGSGVEDAGDAWFSLFEKQINSEYGAIGKRIPIVQSGATAFEGILKYTREKPRAAADLIFIVFGENDRKYMDAKDFSFFYEQLLRRVKLDHPDADIITFTESCLAYEDFAEEIKRLSALYGADNIDMRVPFRKSGFSERQLTKDLVHPNEHGYELYAKEIMKTVNMKTAAGEEKPPVMPQPFNKGISMEYKSIVKPVKASGFTAMGGGFSSSEKGSFLEFEFEGSIVGYTLERGPEGGLVDVFIDGEPAGTLSTWWPFKKERNIYIADSLGSGMHRIRFVHTGESSRPEGLNANASLFIKGIIAGKP